MSAPDAWMKYASEDLRVAEWAYAEKIYNQVCFHSQQCAEKSLKAVLVFEGQIPPKIHRLNTLVALASTTEFQEFTEGLNLLDLVYIPTRYPEAHPGALPGGLPNQKQAAEALQTARDIFHLITKTLSPSGTGDPLP